MDTDPNRNVGRTYRPVRQVEFRSGAPGNRSDTRRDPSRCRTVLRHGMMVTRSRARGGRSMSVEPEVEYRPEGEFPQEVQYGARDKFLNPS